MAAKNYSVGIAHRTVVPTNATAGAEESSADADEDADEAEDADEDA